MADSFNQSLASGLSLGVRMQELRSQRALQQLRERQVAQQLALQLQQHNMQVDMQADQAKAAGAMQAEMMMNQPVMTPQAGPPLPGGGEALPDVPVANPNAVPIEDIVLKHTLPFTMKWGAMSGGRTPLDVLADYSRVKQAKTSGAGFQPSVGSVTLPSGKVKEFATTGAGSARFFDEGVAERMRERYTLAEQAKMLDWVRDKRSDLYSRLPKDDQGRRFVPDDVMDQVAKQAGITPATRAMLEATEVSTEQVFAMGKRILPLINERTTGAKAEAKRWAQRLGVTAIFPALDDPEISEAEAVGRTFVSGVIRALRSDGQIGVKEVDALERVGQLINWTTVESGKTKLASFVTEAADKSRRAAQRKGTPINPVFLTPQEIAARVDDNQLTVEEAEELYRNSAAAFIDDIRKQLKPR